MQKDIILKDSEFSTISQEDISEFIDFIEKNEDYLDTGLGAFHTDDHSNW